MNCFFLTKWTKGPGKELRSQIKVRTSTTEQKWRRSDPVPLHGQIRSRNEPFPRSTFHFRATQPPQCPLRVPTVSCDLSPLPLALPGVRGRDLLGRGGSRRRSTRAGVSGDATPRGHMQRTSGIRNPPDGYITQAWQGRSVTRKVKLFSGSFRWVCGVGLGLSQGFCWIPDCPLKCWFVFNICTPTK